MEKIKPGVKMKVSKEELRAACVKALEHNAEDTETPVWNGATA